MPLKVIRYKNYGCTMTSEDDEDKFYSSFFTSIINELA